jgi:hypothetical protein
MTALPEFPPMPRTFRLALAGCLALGCVGFPVAARAQLPQHRLQSIFPAGGRDGDNVDVQVNGTDLEIIHSLWFAHPGLRAFHIKGPAFRVAIAPGTPPGIYDARIVGPLGLSNPRTFVVGDRPEVREKEPNNLPAEANPVTINSVIDGRSDASPDVDCFAFEGKRGQRVFVDLWGSRIESRLDGSLRLLGPAGQVLGQSEDVYEADPFLDVTLPDDGRYVIKVQDVVYNGSADHIYRLVIHDGPHIDAIVPAMATPGVATSFTLLGRNIGGELQPDVMIDGRPLEKRAVTITPPPASEPDPANPAVEQLLSVAAGRRGFEYRFDSPSGRSNPLFIGAATDPVVVETEPNDDDAHAQMVTPPCEISGAFSTPGDLDVYRFKASKGQTLWIEASAERLGSKADPVFVVQKVVEKGPPQELATGDDLPESAPAANFPTATVDAAILWQAPEDGLYQVVINDVYSSQRGDVRLFYRLAIHPARPDFRLFVVPVEPQGLVNGVTIRAGGRTAAIVVATRIDGFTGPIRVEARELPPGVSFDPVTIGQGQFQAPISFTAVPDAKQGVGSIVLVGRSQASDRKEVLDYAAGTSRVFPEVEHVALGGTLVWPPTPNPTGGPPYINARAARGLACAVIEGAPFLLTVRPDSWAVAAGAPVELTVEVVRRPGFTEAVQLSVTDLPPNMGGANATIAKEATSAVLKMTVPGNVPPGNYSFLVRGSGPFPFNKDPNAKDKPNVNVLEPSNPVSLTVRKP